MEELPVPIQALLIDDLGVVPHPGVFHRSERREAGMGVFPVDLKYAALIIPFLTGELGAIGISRRGKIGNRLAGPIAICQRSGCQTAAQHTDTQHGGQQPFGQSVPVSSHFSYSSCYDLSFTAEMSAAKKQTQLSQKFTL